MKRKILAGTTSLSLGIFVAATNSTTGGGLSGLVFDTASLVAEYRRAGQATWTAITLVTGKTLGTFLSSGFIADGALTGAYEVDVPNAAVAAGARFVLIRLHGAANMLPVLIEIELDAIDYQDGVRGGLTALPNNTRLAESASTMIAATASGTPTTTSIPTSSVSVTPTVANQFSNRLLIFLPTTTTTALRGQVTTITASTSSATPTLTVGALTTAPVSGDTFIIV